MMNKTLEGQYFFFYIYKNVENKWINVQHDFQIVIRETNTDVRNICVPIFLSCPFSPIPVHRCHARTSVYVYEHLCIRRVVWSERERSFPRFDGRWRVVKRVRCFGRGTR